MAYQLKVASREKKDSKSEGFEKSFVADSSNVESLMDRRKQVQHSKARQKILAASAKLTW
jgi:hypothetical protein